MPLFISNFKRVFLRFGRPEKRTAGWDRVLFSVSVLSICSASILNRSLFTDYPAPSIYQEARSMLDEKVKGVALGASLIRAGLRPSYISDTCVNLAPDAAGYAILELILKENMSQLANLDWAIIELDNLCLCYDRLSKPDQRQSYELGVPRRAIAEARGRKTTDWLTDNFMVYPFFFLPRLTPADIFERIEEQGITDREPGFESLKIAMTPEILAQRNLRRDFDLLNSPVQERNKHAMYEMIDALLKNNVKVILLRMPQSLETYTGRGQDYHAHENKFVSRVLDRYGVNVSVWDMRRLQGVDSKLFSDTRHLNVEGAAWFSTLVDQKLIATQ